MGLREGVGKALRDLPLGIHKVTPPGVRQALRHRVGLYYAWEKGFDFHNTPELGPGETNGPPDFIGIGVQKAGTSWWFSLIANHPQVRHLLSIPRNRNFVGSFYKERSFFARFATEDFGPKDVEEYHQWFPRAVGTITGEWTPDYLYYPWLPPLVAEAAPDAKLLLILRDPIHRFRSGYAESIRSGSTNVGFTAAEAIGHSLYADNISRWMDHFPSEQLLVLQYEQCVAAPAEQLEKTYRFLGLDPGHRPARMERPVNKTIEVKPKLDDAVTRRLRDIFEPDVAKLARLLPSLDLSLWTVGGDRELAASRDVSSG